MRGRLKRFGAELYRRNVVRAVSAYLAFAWLTIQLAHLMDHAMGISGIAQRWVMIFLCVGMIPTLTFSWRYELTSKGVQEEDKMAKPKRVHHHLATMLDRITVSFLIVAFLAAIVDQMFVEQVSPHDYPTFRELRDTRE